jgi:hypothetical protein
MVADLACLLVGQIVPRAAIRCNSRQRSGLARSIPWETLRFGDGLAVRLTGSERLQHFEPILFPPVTDFHQIGRRMALCTKIEPDICEVSALCIDERANEV